MKLAHSQGDPFSPPVLEDEPGEPERDDAPEQDAQVDAEQGEPERKPAKGRAAKGKAKSDDDALKAKLDAALAKLDES